MAEQSYPSLFTLTVGFIPLSVKRLLCDFDYKPMSLVKISTGNWCCPGTISQIIGGMKKLLFCKLHY